MFQCRMCRARWFASSAGKGRARLAPARNDAEVRPQTLAVENGTTGERDPKPTWSWSPVLGHSGGTCGTRGRSCETPQLQVFGEPLRDDVRGKQGGEGADELIRGTAPWCDVSSRNSA